MLNLFLEGEKTHPLHHATELCSLILDDFFVEYHPFLAYNSNLYIL